MFRDAVGLVAMILSGCTRVMEPCLPDALEGETIDVALVEDYDETATARFERGWLPSPSLPIVPCTIDDGFTAGATIRIRLDETIAGQSCLRYQGTTELPDGSDFFRQGAGSLGGDRAYVTDAREGLVLPSGCSGEWEIGVIDSGGDPRAPIVPGEVPPSLVMRTFIASDTRGCASVSDVCRQYWVATVLRSTE